MNEYEKLNHKENIFSCTESYFEDKKLRRKICDIDHETCATCPVLSMTCDLNNIVEL